MVFYYVDKHMELIEEGGGQRELVGLQVGKGREKRSSVGPAWQMEKRGGGGRPRRDGLGDGKRVWAEPCLFPSERGFRKRFAISFVFQKFKLASISFELDPKKTKKILVPFKMDLILEAGSQTYDFYLTPCVHAAQLSSSFDKNRNVESSSSASFPSMVSSSTPSPEFQQYQSFPPPNFSTNFLPPPYGPSHEPRAFSTSFQFIWSSTWLSRLSAI